MTRNDNIPNTSQTNQSRGGDGDAIDKIFDRNRLQLSALLDGELPPQEARFLLRRLQHDGALSDRWERWQLCGDVMRGRVDVMLPPGFATRIAAAVAADPHASATGAGATGWLRWGGGAALAASVAVVALLLARQAPDASAPATPAPIAATTVAPKSTAAPVLTASSAPDKPANTAHLVAALAVADVPRRLSARRSRGQSQRAANRRGLETPAAIAVNAQAPATVPADPFSHANLPNRPWPRTLLPGSPASGAFTVDYGSRSATSPSFYPFEPRRQSLAPPGDAASSEGDTGTANDRDAP